MKLSKIAKNLTSVGMLALIAASITLGVAQFAYAQDKVLNAKKGKSGKSSMKFYRRIRNGCNR